ncbi:MAG TPA: hypothetical protein VFH99_01555 [Candidatus Saccharimonadales bacterium]|nr:hypothetical protein [Candidatus Saccharimonadales bacterium]
MSEIRKMGSRFWELYSKETIFFGGAFIVLVAALLSLVAGVIIGYLWMVITAIQLWSEDLAPFSWIESDRLKWGLIAMAPLTVVGTCIGIGVWVLAAPYFFWRSVQQDVTKRRKQIEEGDKYVELDEPRLRNWLIGVPVYYLCLAGTIFGLYALLKPR